MEVQPFKNNCFHHNHQRFIFVGWHCPDYMCKVMFMLYDFKYKRFFNSTERMFMTFKSFEGPRDFCNYSVTQIIDNLSTQDDWSFL